MDKLDGLSMDNEKYNIEQIKRLFPNVITEGKIDFDKLRLILGDELEERNEKYQFTWNGKSKAIKLAQSPSTVTLRPIKEDSVNWDTTKNLYIEGDNLEVLKQLQKTYFEKIKMIYIDPPYNTGGDFVYKDDFKDSIANYKEQTNQTHKSNAESSGRYHTDWLNMMYPRLMLAKNLLSNDGVIFISIDDNEESNLSKVMDEVFGETNFLGKFVVNSTPNARDYGHIGKMHEYCLMYAKNHEVVSTTHLPDLGKKFKYKDDISPFNIHPLYNSNVAFTNMNRPNLYYPFYVNPKKNENGFFEIGLHDTEGSIEVFPPKSVKDNVQFVWRWGKQKAIDNMNIEIVGYKVGDEYRIVQKMRNTSKVIRSLLLEKKYSSRRGTAEVENIMGNKIFNFPKPMNLIYDFVCVATTNDDIILDFFSGSATTAHAVMKLNAEDGGNRKFIMVQLPEKLDVESEAYKLGYKNICEMGKERIRRVAKQLLEEFGGNHKTPDKDFGFKVFKLDETNIKEWDSSLQVTETTLFDHLELIKEDRTKEDVLYEILLKYGVFNQKVKTLTINNKEVYDISEGYMIVDLNDSILEEDIKSIVNLKPQVVIFMESAFANDNDKLNAEYTLKRNGVKDIKCI